MLKLFTGYLGITRSSTIQKLSSTNTWKLRKTLSSQSSPLRDTYTEDIENNMSASVNQHKETDCAQLEENNVKGKERKRRHKKKNKNETNPDSHNGSHNIDSRRQDTNADNRGQDMKATNICHKNGFVKHSNRKIRYSTEGAGNRSNHSEKNHSSSSNGDSNGSKGNSSDTKARKQPRNMLPEVHFENYISLEDCSARLKRGELIKGSLRINARSYLDAFIDDGGGGRDINIVGMEMRNRALPGDIVAVEILPEDQWKYHDEKLIAKTGKVVYIVETKHNRVAAGHIAAYRNHAFGFALMSPVDSRLPRLMIPLTECPANFKTRPKDFEKTLFVASIVGWGLNMAFATGKLMRSLGEAGHIEPETEAILASNDIDSSDFKDDVLKCLPDGNTWEITKDELAKRKDLRNECIFTIDPATARDLDDALSCKKIGEDLYEVGVHIADVSHFIEQENALDEIAQNRATSVYLAQKVIPMLPRVLCEQLCSLNPGVERLAYSVIWNLKSDGTVVREWFGRSVIRSCVKLSYDHAQQMIESETNDVNAEEYPQIFGGFQLKKIAAIVKDLYGISAHLRKQRFDSGALKIDMPKLAFTLDDDSGTPNGCRVYEYKNSNEMIEEFMLFANMAVGRKIYREHPKIAILRLHPPPQEMMMHDLHKICELFDIPFDIRDSASINASLRNIALQSEGNEQLYQALTLMCAKPFQNAKYFCTGSIEDESQYRHYALNVPIYTHFTSPIRRYPDIMVHRLLTAALKPDFKVNDDIKQLQTIADHCNDKKWAAKKASEQSSLLFFAIYVKECGPISEKGVVVGVLNRAIDVLSTRLGTVNRVYTDQLSIRKHDFNNDEELKPKITLHWVDDSDTKKGSLDDRLAALTKQFEQKWQAQSKEKEDPDADVIIEDETYEGVIKQELTLFSPVELILTVKENAPTKIVATIPNPHNSNENPELGL